MRLFVIPLIFLPLSMNGEIAEPDTVTAKDLGEITVVADFQRTSAAKTIYIPTSGQKSMASDGISLLSMMNIPQLSVNPLTEKVKTVGNQNITLFINSQQATAEEIRGLNPADVKKVEYLDFPIDPRFQRAEHAVNFILHDYSYGGYTKVSGKARFFIHSAEASIYSKFSYREMEYDLMVSGDSEHNFHVGSITDEVFRLESGTINRESGVFAGKVREHGFHSALRASWIKHDSFSFRNLVSYHRTHTPIRNTFGYVDFSRLFLPSTYLTESPSVNNTIMWDSELYASLGKGWTLDGNFQAEITGTRTTDNYHTETYSIVNSADEKSGLFRGTLQTNKSLSDKVTLFSSVSYMGDATKIVYSGSSNATNKFNQRFCGLTLGMALNYTKVSGSIDGGYAFESNRINGKPMSYRYPFIHVNLQYSPDTRNSCGLWMQCATFSPDAAMKNPNTIQQSELLYMSGNPDLKCSRNISSALSYTWLPNNQWQLTAYATLFIISNRQIAVYTPEGPEGMILKMYRNDGDYNHGQIGASVTGKFFDGKLSVSGSTRLLLYKTTGSNNVSHYPFIASINADYLFGSFFLNGYYASGNSYVDGESAYLRRMPHEYSIGVGWSSRGFNLQVSFSNLFRSSRRISTDTLRTPWYDSRVIQVGSEFSRRITLNFTYTFNYGKRVNQSEEIAVQKNNSSSILR